MGPYPTACEFHNKKNEQKYEDKKKVDLTFNTIGNFIGTP
jgi:hypothetical protein